jgi:hypothetical protein
LCVHFPVEGQLEGFQSEALMNKATMNKSSCARILAHVFSFFLNKHLRVEWLGHKEGIYLVLLETLFSKKQWSYHFTLLHKTKVLVALHH